MAKAGYLSQLDYSKVVEMGDFYTVLQMRVKTTRTSSPASTFCSSKLKKEKHTGM